MDSRSTFLRHIHGDRSEGFLASSGVNYVGYVKAYYTSMTGGGLVAAIVGGLGNFTGSIIAGLLLGVMETFGAGYISSQYKDAFAFIILLVVLVISPNGILALWRKRRARS